MVSCRRRFSSKLALAAILCLCAVTGLLAQSARKLTLASEVEAYFQDWGGSFLPRWSGHALLGPVLGDGSHVWVITKDGQREDVRFTFPGAGWITIVGASRRPDGALALIGAAASSDSQMGRFVAWISPDRTRQAVVRVTPYSPKTVTFAPDGRSGLRGRCPLRSTMSCGTLTTPAGSSGPLSEGPPLGAVCLLQDRI